MPVVAVGFAVALDVGAMGALAAGTLTTLAAVTAIGATVSAVGAVTGNKTLTLVGAGLGIVGAVGSLASGAGVFDNVSDLFSSSSAGAGAGGSSIFDNAGLYDAEAGGSAAAAETASDASMLNATGGVIPGAINTSSLAPPAALAPAEGNAAAIETGGDTTGALAQSLSPGAGGTGTINSTAGAAAGSSAADATSGASVPDFFHTSGLYDAAAGGPIRAGGGAGIDAGGGLMAWANKNPMLAFGAMQAGGAFISGLTNPMTPAQIDALNAQSEVNRATAELIKRQNANQAAPLPTATVTGRVAPTTAGLINTKPVGTAMITGAPNTGGGTAAPMLSTGVTG